MANTSQMVRVDVQKMRDEFDKRMLVPTEAAREIGIHDAYMSKTFSRGNCNCHVVMKLQQRFGIDPETYVDPDHLWKVRRAMRFEEEMKAAEPVSEGKTEQEQPKAEPSREYLHVTMDAFLQALATTVYEAVKQAIKEEREERKHDAY